MMRLLIGVMTTVLSGCGASSDRSPTPVASHDGVLTVAWSIDGSTDPTQCSVRGVRTVDIVVETPARDVADERVAPCEALVAEMSLPPGAYYADITLLDQFEAPVTQTVYLGRVRLYGADEWFIDADFPPDAFYGSP